MEKKINILLGIIGGFALTSLQIPVYIGIRTFGDMGGYEIESIIKLFSWVGMITIIFFSILLIIDTLKVIYKK